MGLNCETFFVFLSSFTAAAQERNTPLKRERERVNLSDISLIKALSRKGMCFFFITYKERGMCFFILVDHIIYKNIYSYVSYILESQGSVHKGNIS